MGALSTLTKQQLCDALADCVGSPRDTLGPGSKEHLEFLRAVASQLGLDTSGGKHDVARRIVEFTGQPWDGDCYSEGDTVTSMALMRMLKGLSRTDRYADAGYQATVAQLVSQDPAADLPKGASAPVRLRSVRESFVRDPEVAAYVLRRARGLCEGCRSEAPFCKPDRSPYLEIHHVTPLANGGPDTVDNTVALCPNCHRRAHHAIDAIAFGDKLRRGLAMRGGS
jgi:hypothetical protein